MNPFASFAYVSASDKKRPAAQVGDPEDASPKSRSRKENQDDNAKEESLCVVTPEKGDELSLAEEEKKEEDSAEALVSADADTRDQPTSPPRSPGRVRLQTGITSFFASKNNPVSPTKIPGAANRDGDFGPKSKSFGAVTAAQFSSLQGKDIPIHTLILGTHPSVESLSKSQYYGHYMNAFWWIIGDCLGFRRAPGVSVSGRPYPFAKDLRHQNVISYDKQLEVVCANGFAIWDIVKACQRQGSLDNDIKNDVPNEIRQFCESHPTVKRIALTGGVGGFKLLKKHFPDWLSSGELVLGPDPFSQRMSKSWGLGNARFKGAKPQRKIMIVIPPAVSPAARQQTYKEKRDAWEESVFRPALLDFRCYAQNEGEKGAKVKAGSIEEK